MKTLNQRITIEYADQQTVIVVTDWQDWDADRNRIAYKAGDFDMDDLFGTLADEAIVETDVAGHRSSCTGREFRELRLWDDLGEVKPTTVTFTDVTVVVAPFETV